MVLFGFASWRAGVLPRGALALYIPGLCAAALRASVPEAVYLGGLTLGSAGVLWLAVALYRGILQSLPAGVVSA